MLHHPLERTRVWRLYSRRLSLCVCFPFPRRKHKHIQHFPFYFPATRGVFHYSASNKQISKRASCNDKWWKKITCISMVSAKAHFESSTMCRSIPFKILPLFPKKSCASALVTYLILILISISFPSCFSSRLSLAWVTHWNLQWFDSEVRVWRILIGLYFLWMDQAKSNVCNVKLTQE